MLLSTETLLGSDVKNPQGQAVGDLKQLMLDPHAGRVMYAVVAMGGFLGMGGKTVIVPWNALEVARNGKSLVLNVSPQMLQQAPAYAKGKESLQVPAGESRGGGWGVDTPYGRLRFAGSGFQLAHGGGKLDAMAPALSAHTDEVLASLGYDAAAIADLRAREIV